MPSTFGVAINPGITTLQRIPALAHSAATASQPPRTATASTSALPIPPAAPVTITRRPAGEVLAGIGVLECSAQPVALPVPVRDVGRILVPVPGARVAAEVVRWIARVQRIADPPDR